MMENNYFIPEKGYSQEIQEQRNEITCIRISKVMDYLLGTPFILDFDLKKPLIKDIDYTSFENQTKRSNNFEELPRFIKDLVYKAEKMKHFDLSFIEYLTDREMSVYEYKNKNPKTKQDIFFDWLFLNNLDITILNI